MTAALIPPGRKRWQWGAWTFERCETLGAAFARLEELSTAGLACAYEGQSGAGHWIKYQDPEHTEGEAEEEGQAG